jgi:hypothetical protein
VNRIPPWDRETVIRQKWVQLRHDNLFKRIATVAKLISVLSKIRLAQVAEPVAIVPSPKPYLLFCQAFYVDCIVATQVTLYGRLLRACLLHKVDFSYQALAVTTHEVDLALVTIFNAKLADRVTGSILMLDNFNLNFALGALVLGRLHPLFDAFEAVSVRTLVQLGSVVR